ncbi:glycosyltransferase [Paenibacillus sp. FSL W8-0186]|uniref:Glycosyltransferase 2-like domain-containing protein n=1 Tax=Paenibacillus woosongensis TaxID=307580 RepID=A0ABQ4MWA4_9BACL|nr:glycosyltransferase [Paenibacillus woosongensis]GIP60216.1 hypothetical protein J15TS10_40300 [Paenibacillus woosongensis]
MKKSTISLCMIVKNEERCIQRCLDSVASVVDEIIIVDTGSTDKTLELLNKYDAKIFHYQWDNNFANARNYAIEQATSDYILQLDADEWIEDPLNQLKQHLTNEIYYIPIRNDLGGGLAEIHKFPRLFVRIPELMYHGAIHEQIDIQSNWHRSSQILSEMIIHHDGYLTKVVNQQGKLERNLQILLKEVDENPSAFNYYNLGQQYFISGEYTKALEAYKKSYSYGDNYTFTIKLLLGLIQSLIMLKQYKDALSIANDAFKLYSNYVEFKYYEGLIYQELGYLPDARECFENCIEVGDSDVSIHFNTYEGTGSYLASTRLAEIAYSNFEFGQADANLRVAISQAPHVMGLLKSLLDFNLYHDNEDLFKQISALWPQEEKVIQQLIEALYQLRHPVIIQFMNKYNIKCDEEALSFINLLKGNYEDSWNYWSSKQKYEEKDQRDILLVSILMQNKELAERILQNASLRTAEKRVILKLIEMKDIKCENFTKDFQDIVSVLITDILRLQKYDLIDYFMNQFTTSQMRFILAKAMYEQGFYEVLLDVLLQGTNQEESYNINLLAAQALRRLNMLEDSLYHYKEAYKNKPDAEIAFHICNLAIQTQDANTLKSILGEMMNWDIVSKWVNSQLSTAG